MTADAAIIERLLGHNAWATRVLLERCEDLSPEQFARRFDIGPGSLQNTLLHVVGAMRRWSDRLQGATLRPSVEDEKLRWTPREILSLLDRTSSELEDAVRALVRGNRLEETMTVHMRDRREPLSFTRGTAIVHVLTHGAHHRAQALNMLRRLRSVDGGAPRGEDLPEVDAISWELETAQTP